jgi:hypothetical protein
MPFAVVCLALAGKQRLRSSIASFYQARKAAELG